MSYILDALRRADAERDRGNVPGIHAQPSFGGAAPTRATAAARPWPWVVAGGLTLLLVGALGWKAFAPRAVSEAPLAVAAAPTSPTAPTSPPIAAAAPPAALPALPVPSPDTPRARPEPSPGALARAKPKPAPSAPSASTAPATADAQPAAPAGEKVYAVAELPDDIRRQLPNVAVGGAMYSARPADRILILNGQVMHEGDRITPDLVLQQIRLKSALLNFKGYRYTLNF